MSHMSRDDMSFNGCVFGSVVVVLSTLVTSKTKLLSVDNPNPSRAECTPSKERHLHLLTMPVLARHRKRDAPADVFQRKV